MGHIIGVPEPNNKTTLALFTAARHPGIVVAIATSNFPQAIDQALLSRADVVLTVPLPGATARRQILETTLAALAREFPNVGALSAGRGSLDRRGCGDYEGSRCG